MDDPVKLIVKASNQQFDDQTIECELNWTIRKLKEHLYEVYPSKPKPADQKLIYSGQLLKDKLMLKDILRHYEGVQSQIHTLHLVCAPKLRYPTFGTKSSNPNAATTAALSSSSSTDGLRQRHTSNVQQQTAATVNQVTSAAASQQSNNIPHLTTNHHVSSSVPMGNNCPITSPFNMASGAGGNNYSPLFNPIGFNQQQQFIPNEYMLAQQVAAQNWMQQAYIQYMNQYMSLLSTGIRPETVFMQNLSIPTSNATSSSTASAGVTNFGGLPQMPYYAPQNFPFNMMNTATNFTASAATPSNLANIGTTVAGAETATTIPVPPPSSAQNQPQPQPQAQPQPENQQPPAPRFPNLMQDDVQENRDWLDVFYSFSRFMVLLTLIYLYSTPLRCLLVAVIVLGIYLYHTAYFRVQRQQQDNNNNNGAQAIRRPEVNQRQQQQPLLQQEVPQPQNNENDSTDDAAAAATETDQENSTNIATETSASTSTTTTTATAATNERETVSNNLAVEEADGTSMIAFLKTFVVSFIVSLLPETPPV